MHLTKLITDMPGDLSILTALLNSEMNLDVEPSISRSDSSQKSATPNFN
jgi:hypothetical protein